MRFLTALLFPADDNYKRALLRFLGIGIFFHLIAVVFSDGYHRTDEFHSIANFVFYKLGYIDESVLVNVNWEYPAAIRSWLQPSIYLLWLKPFVSLGLRNPFHILTLMRLLSSCLAIIATLLFIQATRKYFKDFIWQRIFIFLSFTIWFFPFFHARTTAENFGIIALIFGLIPFLKEAPTLWGQLIGSFFLTLAVALRIPSAPTVAAIYFWFLFIGKNPFKSLKPIIVGSLLAIFLIYKIDSWGYGRGTLSILNYLYAEFTRSISKGYGVDPWWRYFELVFARGIFPLSLIFILSFLWFWIRRPLHLMTFVTLSFFLLHTLVAHKELRFIFGLGMFLPFMITMTLSDWWQFEIFRKFFKEKIGRTIAFFIILINLILMSVVSFRSPYRQLGFYKYLYDSDLAAGEIKTIHEISQPIQFFLKVPMKFTHILDPELDLKGIIATETLRDIKFFMLKKECHPLYLSMSAKLLLKIDTSKFDRTDFWALFQCQ